MKLLEVKNLSFSYTPNELILNDLSFSVEAGEFVFILGDSGSGKSTLLSIVGSLLKPSQGSVSYFGKNIYELSEAQVSKFRNKHIGFIFQKFNLLSKLSSLKNILLPIHYSEERLDKKKEEVLALARKFKAEQFLGKKPQNLSGGQQQRISLLRALANKPSVILADEATGSLDSSNTEEVLKVFQSLHEQGNTILFITHNEKIAQTGSRIIQLRDGKIIRDKKLKSISKNVPVFEKNSSLTPNKKSFFRSSFFFKESLSSLSYKKTRSALTVLGVAIGVAAIFSMLTLGKILKERIISNYQELGVNTFLLRGYQNWRSTQNFSPGKPSFQSFHVTRDLARLKKDFPEIKLVSPLLSSWNGEVSYASKKVEDDVRVLGSGKNYLNLIGQELLAGNNFSSIDNALATNKCILGFEIAKELFPLPAMAYKKTVSYKLGEKYFNCLVWGVMKNKQTSSDKNNVNKMLVLPLKTFQNYIDRPYQKEIHKVYIQVNEKAPLLVLTQKVKNYFEKKYGKSGDFRISSNIELVDQMKRFVFLFNTLLLVVAGLCLLVGSVGIANMMLVSLGERIKEISIKRSLGASLKRVKAQLMLETIILCFIAGCLGLLGGFVFYELMIWAASKVIKNFEFHWVFDWSAFLVSFGIILLVGYLCGVFPAKKASEIDVALALTE